MNFINLFALFYLTCTQTHWNLAQSTNRSEPVPPELLEPPEPLESSQSNLKIIGWPKPNNAAERRRRIAAQRMPKAEPIAAESLHVELMLIIDSKLAHKHHNDRGAITEKAENIARLVDRIFFPLGIRVFLIDVEIWSSGDPFPVSSNGTDVLRLLLDYRQLQLERRARNSAWRRADAVHLLSAVDFAGDFIALGAFDKMCTYRAGGVESVQRGDSMTALLVAHELGHNLGLEHDGRECACGSGGFACVMTEISPRTLPSAPLWSDCSRVRLKANIANFEVCLLNKPLEMRHSLCGNRVLEDGEQCDCGAPGECASPCCDPWTCRLHEGAMCGAGPCCDNCMFASVRAVCRGTYENECDIADHCSGVSAFCSADVYRENGAACAQGSGTCYGGVCRSHDEQCRTLWGAAAFASLPLCYITINRMADDKGNCGRSNNGELWGLGSRVGR